jgi:alkanesulfonate monooxygenase SsuD/methylene tetrahydromethanopterin reductase-like flavin-dependent oxidoreductase (luciferase family)
VKFHWFAEVTYPEIPEDRSLYPSGWVDAPVRTVDSKAVGATYRMFIRLLQLADAVGFDGLAVNEHHQTPFAMTPSPNLLAASLAGTTERAAILVIGDSLALYNPPTRVAEELAYLDCLSGGRVIAGFVVGTPMDSVFSYGVPPVELRERFQEARALILRAWQADEPFCFNGKYTKLRYVNVLPRPIQQPPPVWVPGTGSVETMKLVLDEDYCYGHLSFSGLKSAKPVVDDFWDYIQRNDGNTNPHRMAFTQICCVAESDREAERNYSDAVKYFYTRNRMPFRFMQPPGYHGSDTLRSQLAGRGGRYGLTPEDRARSSSGDMSFWEYDEKGFIIAGTPERVRDRIRELAVELRVGQLIACLHVGNLPEQIAAANTTLFGTEVIPHLRDLWADEPDYWTPTVSQERVGAASQAMAELHQ